MPQWMLVLYILPPLIAGGALIYALKKEYQQNTLFLAAGITMVITMLTMEHLTLIGFFSLILISLSVCYIALLLFSFYLTNKEKAAEAEPEAVPEQERTEEQNKKEEK